MQTPEESQSEDSHAERLKKHELDKLTHELFGASLVRKFKEHNTRKSIPVVTRNLS